MIALSPFEKSDFDTFISWIESSDELFQFAGQGFDYPLTTEQLDLHVLNYKSICYKVICTKTNEYFGHCEVNYANSFPRLSRIFIGVKSYRNKGIGKLIVNSLLEKLFNEEGFEKADLNVFDWNQQAIKCYQKVGFEMNEDLVYRRNNNGKIWLALNMSITKSKWQNHKIK